MQEQAFWDTCLELFEKSLPPQQFNSWIKPLKLTSDDGHLVLTAPNTFTLKIFLKLIVRQSLFIRLSHNLSFVLSNQFQLIYHRQPLSLRSKKPPLIANLKLKLHSEATENSIKV
jgi:chromosomal replication initiation ATPase DnaA